MDKLYTMKEASKLLGLSIRHIQKLNQAEKIKCIRTPGGRRRISESEIKRLRGKEEEEKIYAIYARVSSHEQKAKGDLGRQIEYIKNVLPKNCGEAQVITDVGSGLNDERKGLLQLIKLVKENKITDVAIADKDRLTRFGFHYLYEFFLAFGVQIHILNGEKNKSLEDELVQDMLSIVTSFSGKLYGLRSAKIKRLLENVRNAIQEETKERGCTELSSCNQK